MRPGYHRGAVNRAGTGWVRWTIRASVAALIAAGPAGCLDAPDPRAFSTREVPSVTPGAVTEIETAASAGGEPLGETAPAALRARSMERRAREMTVRIRATGCGGLGTGSGFAVGDGLIVTNRHVVEGATRVSLNTWDGDSLEADVAGVDYSDDLALVRVAASLPFAARLADSDTEAGSPVTAVGFPLGGQQTLAEGHVVDYARLEHRDGPRILRLTSEIWPGNSGGPVLDEKGAVVGVVFAIERATDYALAVPVSQLSDLLTGGAETGGAPGCTG